MKRYTVDGEPLPVGDGEHEAELTENYFRDPRRPTPQEITESRLRAERRRAEQEHQEAKGQP